MLPSVVYTPDPHLIPGRFCPATPNPRNAQTINQLQRAWGCAEFAKIVAKNRKGSQ